MDVNRVNTAPQETDKTCNKCSGKMQMRIIVSKTTNGTYADEQYKCLDCGNTYLVAGKEVVTWN